MHKADVHVYTDGAASGNPGPGGYGIVMEWVGQIEVTPEQIRFYYEKTL